MAFIFFLGKIKSIEEVLRMTLELKLKRAALNAAVDIALKGLKKSPERCARNLIELGTTAFPDAVNKADKEILYDKLLYLCKKIDTEAAKELFFSTFK